MKKQQLEEVNTRLAEYAKWNPTFEVTVQNVIAHGSSIIVLFTTICSATERKSARIGRFSPGTGMDVYLA